MARAKKDNKETVNKLGIYDKDKIMNSVTEESKDNYDVRTIEIAPNITIKHYLFDSFELATILVSGFAIKCRIAATKDGRKFISFPAYKNKSGEYENTAYAFDKDLIEVLKYVIF